MLSVHCNPENSSVFSSNTVVLCFSGLILKSVTHCELPCNSGLLCYGYLISLPPFISGVFSLEYMLLLPLSQVSFLWLER